MFFDIYRLGTPFIAVLPPSQTWNTSWLTARSYAFTLVPPQKNREEERPYDKHLYKHLYKEHHKIECLFGFLKYYRRLFAHHDKLKRNFSAFLHFAAALQAAKIKSQQNLYTTINLHLSYKHLKYIVFLNERKLELCKNL